MDYTVEVVVMKLEDMTPMRLDAGDIIAQAEYEPKLSCVYFIILRMVKQ